MNKSEFEQYIKDKFNPTKINGDIINGNYILKSNSGNIATFDVTFARNFRKYRTLVVYLVKCKSLVHGEFRRLDLHYNKLYDYKAYNPNPPKKDNMEFCNV